MNSVTIKTLVGFFKTMIGKYTPINIGKNYIEGIYNYRKYNDNLSSSGQATEEQFKLIQQEGFTTVINLAPHNAENSLENEANTLLSLGIKYIHIPVDFQKPTEENFQNFITSYTPLKNTKTWVHCAANMRVSAFLYRYRRDILGMPDAEARKIMDTIWEPFGEWQNFLKK
jgi:protein tyrosine phosphatase (PTP) superfamily phosphohydrolase (DUF442 family)